MNEKQAKLLRYFVKHTGQLKMAAAFKIGFQKLSHKKKGKLTRWIKQAIVTDIQLKQIHREAKAQANRETLKGFSV